MTYTDAAGRPGQQLLYRDNEPTLEIAQTGRPWSFDGDGALLRLVSEAYRIRLAYLFDPYLAVQTSLVEELRPTDYFSQSQQQTLLLGLFLTACISQTWSVLSPVFLDDPVTHFDDLNTYAFLDLIVGLLESDFGKRQFMISTCDEKLLQLAQHKLRHLGGRAKFYRFSAIGAEGPVVDEIGLS
jgi:hypothetical protein